MFPRRRWAILAQFPHESVPEPLSRHFTEAAARRRRKVLAHLSRYEQARLEVVELPRQRTGS
jgi:hypothetical protein